MKKTDIAVGTLVATADYDRRIERAEVLEVGATEHRVEFQTGAFRGQERLCLSRSLQPWESHAEEWESQRRDELQHETRLAMLTYNRKQAIEELETVKDALSTLGIEAGVGQVLERVGDKMEKRQALFIVTEEAAKLLPVVTGEALRELTT